MYTVGNMNITLELFGVFVSLIILVCLFTSTDRKSTLTWLFTRIVLCNIAALAFDIIAWVFDGNVSTHAFYIVRVAKFFSYSLSYLMIPLLTDYLIALIGKNIKISKRLSHIMYALFLVAVALVAVSQFNNMYYDFDENNMYRVQGFFWLSQVLGAIYLAINTIVILRYWKSMPRSETFFLLSYAVFPLLAMIKHILIWAEFEFVFIASTLAIVASYGGIQAQQARVLKQKELELTENRISVMISQIQPHFIYNTLVVIKQLCDIDPKKAKETVLEFSGYLRSTLDSIALTHPIPFDTELQHTQNYLSLEKKRFGEKIKIEYDIHATDFMLPALTLQPIVENAIRYGITKKEEGGTVSISSKETDNSFVIIVCDNGTGLDQKLATEDASSSFSLDNVMNRLSAMCGGRLTIKRVSEQGTSVKIEIPKRRS